MGVYLLSTGACLPGEPIDNEAFTQFPPAALPLIGQKTGMRRRHKAAPDQPTSALAVEAGRQCLERAAVSPAEVGVVIVATSTPDRLIPATATRVAHALGARNAFAFDVNSVCSGSVFLLEIARGLLLAGSAKTALVIGADTYSKFLNPADFSTFPYFGDGAGAALLSFQPERAANNGADGKTSGPSTAAFPAGAPELLGGVYHSDGSGFDTVTIKSGGSELPVGVAKTDRFFTMNGRAVFEFALTRGTEIVRELIAKHAIAPEQIRQVILHQANINIIRQIAEKLELPAELFFAHLDQVGNTAGASTLIALNAYLETVNSTSATFPTSGTDGYLFLAGFGGGLSWGGSVLRFA